MKTTKVGRSSSNDFVVSSNAVSSQHCVLTGYDDGRMSIKDLNSTNGTYVNGKKIAVETFLKQGDSVMLGNTPLDWMTALNAKKEESHKTVISQIPVNSDIYTIGRDASNSIRLSFDDVSSRHATLSRSADGSIVITDNNSTNGTYVNGLRITSQILKHGDKIMIARKYPVEWEGLFPAQSGSGSNNGGKKGSNVATIIICAILGLLIIGGGAWWFTHRGPKAMEPTEIYAMYKKSVAMIYVESSYVATVDGKPLGEWFENTTYWVLGEDGTPTPGQVSASGTGFFISRDGRLMTNRHVVSDDDIAGTEEKIKKYLQNALYSTLGYQPQVVEFVEKLNVKYNVSYLGIALNDTHLSSRDDLSACSVVKVSKDEDLDLAIIQLNSKTTPAEVVNIVDLENNTASPEQMTVGNEVFTIGFPQGLAFGSTQIGLEANNQNGLITQERGEYTYGTNMAVHHGASGSPVFNKYGQFAGVVVSGFADMTQGYNHAINPQKAVEFIK